MKVRYRDTELPVNMIYPHPNNPRRDVDDITELAESIKANGIFQNLTVVWGGKGVEAAHPDEDDPDGYTVIIGHRRLAAAKAAGLEMVPCMVVEMDEREQAATMLLENMQRADLTVYEQAQGFQMMLDLGETQEGIAKKTGLSKTTIRHRLKLLELDQEELRKAEERQATFADYIELEKIKDPEKKNEALKTIGTQNFKWKVNQIISQENAGENLKKNVVMLEEMGLKRIPYDKRFGYRQIGYLTASEEPDDKKREELEDLIQTGDAKYYTISSDAPEYAWVYIYTDASKQTEADKAAEAEKRRQEDRRRERDRKVSELEKQAADLRKAFVKDFANREFIPTITEAFLGEAGLDDIDYEEVAEILDIDSEKYDSWEAFLKGADYRDRVKKHPESVMLAMLSTINEGMYKTSLHDYEGRYQRNTRLENWYAILTRVRYKMSSDETKLLSGTHECFK